MSLASRSRSLVATLCLVATPAVAQFNQLSNSGFHEDVEGWEPVEMFMSIVFDEEDVDGDEESGSARVTFEETLSVATRGRVAQCIGVLPGAIYTGSASFLIPAGQMRVGTAALRLVWFESDDCSGSPIDADTGPAGAFVGDWDDLMPFEFEAPGDALSAEVQLELEKPVLGGTFEALFDEVSLLPEPSTGVSGLAAVIAAAGCARWARRRTSLRPGETREEPALSPRRPGPRRRDSRSSRSPAASSS